MFSKFFLWLISQYQKLSKYTKPKCVFYPTCSEYTREAIRKFGLAKGTFLGLRRLLRCHPWQKNQVDLP